MYEGESDRTHSADGRLAPGEDWTQPRTPGVPAPTIWPVIAALSIVTLLFGFLTSWVILAVGFVLFVISMKHWIGELNRDN